MKSYICQKCKKVIDFDEIRPIDEVVIDHMTNCACTPVQPVGRRITDIVPEDIMKGNFLSMDDILGKEVLITEMEWIKSAYREDEQYLTLSLEIDGETKKVNTGATRVVDVFKHVDELDLPIYARFEKITLPNGRRVYKVT